MKKFISILVPTLPWYIGLLFLDNHTFDSTISVFLIGIWFLLFILLGFTIYKVYYRNTFLNTKQYTKTLVTHFVLMQSYFLITFQFHCLFYSFVFATLSFISSLYLYVETKEQTRGINQLFLIYIVSQLMMVLVSFFTYLIAV